MTKLIRYALLCGIMISGAALYSAGTAQAMNLVIVNNNGAGADQGPQRLISSAPYDNQRITPAPQMVMLTFAQPVRADKSFIHVFDTFGTKLNDAPVEVSGNTMSAVLPASLPPGKYTVKWKSRCNCEAGTELNDTFHFLIQ